MKKGRVYKIIHNQSDVVYVGSTTNTLANRWQGHKQGYDNWLNGKSSSTAIYPYFKKYGIRNFKMILVKEYEVVDRQHLLMYEQLWINKLNCCNATNPGHLNFKSIRKIMKQKYVEKNFQHIKEYKSKYYQNNKEKYKAEWAKRYSEDPEKFKEYQKEYRRNNKQKVTNKLKQKVTCECGAVVSKRNLSTHRKSEKHKNFLL